MDLCMATPHVIVRPMMFVLTWLLLVTPALAERATV